MRGGASYSRGGRAAPQPSPKGETSGEGHPLRSDELARDIPTLPPPLVASPSPTAERVRASLTACSLTASVALKMARVLRSSWL